MTPSPVKGILGNESLLNLGYLPRSRSIRNNGRVLLLSNDGGIGKVVPTHICSPSGYPVGGGTMLP
jgi:hypothetical protein